MPFDYHEAKEFFNDKLTKDLAGQGRMESALYHTAKMLYDAGCDDIDRSLIILLENLMKAYEDLCVKTGSAPRKDWAYCQAKLFLETRQKQTQTTNEVLE